MTKATMTKKSHKSNRHAHFNLHNNSVISECHLEEVFFFQFYLRLLYFAQRKITRGENIHASRISLSN